MVNFDKFLASFITEMKECSQMRNFSIPRGIKKALEDQGFEYKDGEIIKTQRRISAEAKESGYGESEDEKIRKHIIEVIKNHFSGENADKCIAWLEKQEGCEHIRKDWLEHIKQSWYKEGFIDGKYSGGASKEWTINDAATLKEIIDFLENGTAKLQHDLTRYANWLKIQFTPIEKQDEQKPAWTEDDRTMAFTLMRDVDQISYISKEGKNERIGWLNSLDEKFASRESTWSEEDDMMLECVLDKIGDLGTGVMCKGWLKSLKNRIKGE